MFRSYGIRPAGRYRPITPKAYIDNASTAVSVPVLTKTSTLIAPTISSSNEVVFASTLIKTATLVAPSLSISVDAPVLAKTATLIAPSVLMSAVAPVLIKTATLIAPDVLVSSINAPVLTKTATLIAPSLALSVSAPVLTKTVTLIAPSAVASLAAAVLTKTATLVAPGFLSSVAVPVLSKTATLVPPTLALSVTAPLLIKTVALVAPTATVSDARAVTVYSLNADLGAASQYTSFDLELIDLGDGTIYAVDADGLYQLTGTTDDGANIQARIRSGQFQPDPRLLSRMDSMDVMAESSGELVAKVTAEGGGTNDEFWYLPHISTATTMKEHIYDIGKRLKSRHWMLEIVNNAGAYGEISQMNLYPILLQSSNNKRRR